MERIIVGVMNLVPQGALLLTLKFKYQKNKLLKTALKLVAPRKEAISTFPRP